MNSGSFLDPDGPEIGKAVCMQKEALFVSDDTLARADCL
jgi:hypothetical protein